MSSPDSTVYWYLTLSPQTYTEEDKASGKSWPPVSSPKPGTKYPSISATEIYPLNVYDPSRSLEFAQEIGRINNLLGFSGPRLRQITSDILSGKNNDETIQQVGDCTDWTEDEAQDKCYNIMKTLAKHSVSLVKDIKLTHTHLEVSWVSKEVVSDAQQINTVANDHQYGTLVLSREDQVTTFAHYPARDRRHASELQFGMFKTDHPDLADFLAEVGIDDTDIESLAWRGFGVVEIGNPSMVHFSWLSRFTYEKEPSWSDGQNTDQDEPL